jgi:cytochrome c oxidase subunit 4
MAAAHGAAPAQSGGHHGVGHVVPLGLLFAVWGALVVFTWVTVAATTIDLGNLNIFIALGIAVVKSALVVLYFMHLRWDNPFNAIVFVGSVLFVMLFIGFTLIDTKEYAPETIPGYAPRMEQAATAAAAESAPAEPAAPAAPSEASEAGVPAAPADTTH